MIQNKHDRDKQVKEKGCQEVKVIQNKHDRDKQVKEKGCQEVKK